jgi:hypothetical protein
LRSCIDARANCRIEYLRLGRPTSATGELVSLTSNGGTISCAKLLPVGQKMRLAFSEVGGDFVGAVVVGCKAEDDEGYAVTFKLTEAAWPYSLYSRLADQSRWKPATASAPACLVALGLTNVATIEDVEDAFGELVRRAHPDRGGGIDDFVKLRRAYLEAVRMLDGRR